MPLTRAEMRMVPSAGVHEPQREFWLVTQRMLEGLARPPRCRWDRSAARLASWVSLGRRRWSPFSSLATMVATHCCSSARVKRAGMSTIVRPLSRYALTVRRRRRLRLTSMSVVPMVLTIGEDPDNPGELRPDTHAAPPPPRVFERLTAWTPYGALKEPGVR